MSNPGFDNAFPIYWGDGYADDGLTKLEFAALWIYTAKLPKGTLPEEFSEILIKDSIKEAKALFKEIDVENA